MSVHGERPERGTRLQEVRTAAPVLLVVTACLLAGCGQDAPVQADEGGAPGPSVSFLEDLPTRSPLKAATTVTGTVTAGVEAGCHLLDDGTTTWLLLADAPAELDAVLGRRVTARGRAEPDLLTTCQQGTPLVVQDLTAR